MIKKIEGSESFASRQFLFGSVGIDAVGVATHRPQSSSFWGFPYRILHMNLKMELLWGLWVVIVIGIVIVIVIVIAYPSSPCFMKVGF